MHMIKFDIGRTFFSNGYDLICFILNRLNHKLVYLIGEYLSHSYPLAQYTYVNKMYFCFPEIGILMSNFMFQNLLNFRLLTAKSQ